MIKPPRTESIGVRCTAAEKSAWTAAAEKDGRSLSSWIVRRCNGEPATKPTKGD